MLTGPFDLPTDLTTPVAAWLALADLRPRYLLESVPTGERNAPRARYSLLGFGDAMEVRLTADSLSIDGVSEPAPEGLEDTLDALRRALAATPRPGPDHPDLPFAGGLVGATGYDVARRLDRIRTPRPAGEGPEAAYVGTRSVLIFDHHTRRAALLHDGTEAERTALKRIVRQRLAGGARPPTPGTHVAAPEPSIDRQSFVDAVIDAQEAIAAGEVFQLVLSVALTGATDVPAIDVYRALRLLNPSPYMYLIDLGDRQLVGASPEALVSKEGRQASLRPIAGTRPRGDTPEHDAAQARELLADPKEAAEHVMLVDLARNDLGRVAEPGTIEVAPYRSVERYSHVMHIVSGVHGRLAEGVDAFELFAATFPAGTVTGAPKLRAMELIDGLEPTGRGLYAGTIGYFGHGDRMDQALAIRTLILSNGQYRYQAGAGIVADSQPAAEHAECLAKGAALGAALRLAAGGL